MFLKILKIIFRSGRSYLVFIWLATFLSLFSYILSSNIILSVEDYLQSQIKPLVGGDIVLSADRDFITWDILDQYQNDFVIANTIETSTTIFDIDKNPSLIQLVYTDKNYPIYDSFSYTPTDSGWDLIVNQDMRDSFGSEIEIFGESYGVGGIIDETPLGNISFFSSFSEVYLPIEAFNAEITADNARLRYVSYLQFRWDYDEWVVDEIKATLRPQNIRVQSLDDRNERIGGVTDRLYLFIHFFNLIVFVLTFFIIILSLETFYKKLKNTIGLLSILGLKKSSVFLYSLVLLGGVFLISFWASFVLNYFVIDILRSQYDFFAVYNISFLKGIAITAVLLFIGVYSPFYKIYKSHISDLLSDSSAFSNFSLKDYGVYLLLIFIGFFLMSYISSLTLFDSALYSFAFIVSIVVLYILVSFLLRRSFSILGRMFSPSRNFYIYDAIRATIKPGNVSFLIVFSSLISFLSIFVFYVFSGSFLGYIDNLTKTSNDTFVINIWKDDIETTREYFGKDEIYEIISLRIREINGRILREHLNTDRVSGRYSREFNSTTRNFDREIISGDEIAPGWVSVDQEFAAQIGISIGDSILFTIAGLEKQLTVQSLRKTERNGANPFFFFTLHPDDFERFPKTYFVSYKSSDKPQDIQFEYSEKVGWGVSFINTGDIIEVVLDIAQKVLLIVYFCLTYIFIFSFLTFIVSITFLRTFKTKKLQLLYILGWQKKKLLSGVFWEYSYLVIGGIILSVMLGTMLLYILSGFIDFFEIDAASYISGLWVLAGLFSIMCVYLKLSKKSL